MSEWDRAILVGVLARTQGNRGEVIVNLETDFPEERFREGAQLMTRRADGTPATLEVASMRMHQGRPVIKFAGVESMDDAERLAGCELRIDEDETEPLPAGQYYHRDLIGCTVVTEGGEQVGTVSAVEGDRGAARLVVKGRRGEVLIPLAETICAIDIPQRRITVRPPEGLLELNGDWR